MRQIERQAAAVELVRIDVILSSLSSAGLGK